MSINEEYNSPHSHEVTFIDENGELKTTKIPVVQELARQGPVKDHFPERFITLPPTTTGTHPTSAIDCQSATPPVIDIAKLKDDVTRELELQRLADAAKEWGVFLIANHGVDDMVLDDVKDAVKGFFGLSFEEKKANVGSYESVDNMGYGKNFVKSEDQPLDWIDRLTMIAAPVDPDEATNCLLIWPKKPANFR